MNELKPNAMTVWVVYQRTGYREVVEIHTTYEGALEAAKGTGQWIERKFLIID
jgi:hypothetical protein